MQTSYEPADSLVYLENHSLVDVALEALYSLADDMSATEQVDLAIDVLETLRTVITHEVRTHGLSNVTHYSTGIPVRTTRMQAFEEVDTDGVVHSGQRELVITPHPTGAVTHPAIDNSGQVA